MIRLTVEETNLLSIYNEGGKRGLMENINAALPFMDEDNIVFLDLFFQLAIISVKGFFLRL